MFRALIALSCLLSAPALAAPNHTAAAAAIRDAANTPEFDDVVTQALLAQYDSNHDGSINKGGELKSIACSVWTTIDAGVREEWGSGVRVIYGFKKGFIWVGYALGIDEKLRKSADKVAAKCGITD